MSFAYYTRQELASTSIPWEFIVPTLYALAVIVYVPLVAYGMLRTQLFDIERLSDVVIGAEFQAFEAVAPFVFCRQEDNRYAFGFLVGPQLLALCGMRR